MESSPGIKDSSTAGGKKMDAKTQNEAIRWNPGASSPGQTARALTAAEFEQEMEDISMFGCWGTDGLSRWAKLDFQFESRGRNEKKPSTRSPWSALFLSD